MTECRLLVESSFATRFDLLLLDSTQRSIPEPSLLTRGWHAGVRVARFVSLIERRKPQAVLAFTSQGASFIEKSLCAAYARARGVPTVLMMRGGPFMDDVRSSALYRRFAQLLLRGADLLPCQGEQWRRFFHDEMGIDEARLPVIHNWTAPADYLIRPRREERSDEPLRILFLAWVDRAKGVFDLLEAVQRLLADATTPAFQLHVAGGGAHAAELRDRVAALGLDDAVVFHGWVAGDEKSALYESADVFVLPSYAEGMPNSMIEAMSLSVPVVVTPVGGITDVIRDGQNGMLVPVRDPAALQATLARLLASVKLRRTIGAAGRKTAQDVFGLEHGVETLEAAIVRIMQPVSPRAMREVSLEEHPMTGGA